MRPSSYKHFHVRNDCDNEKKDDGKNVYNVVRKLKRQVNNQIIIRNSSRVRAFGWLNQYSINS